MAIMLHENGKLLTTVSNFLFFEGRKRISAASVSPDRATRDAQQRPACTFQLRTGLGLNLEAVHEIVVQDRAMRIFITHEPDEYGRVRAEVREIVARDEGRRRTG